MTPFPLALPILGAFVALCSGCQGYTRGSSVPESMRTVHVAAFENRTQYPRVGAVATQQLLDALIEDGTFRPTDYAFARLRVQGVMSSPKTDAVSYDRNNIIVPDEYRLTLKARIYVYDALTGETLMNGKRLSATDTMMTRGDFQSGVIDALPRVSRKLAQAILAELHALGAEPPAATLPAEADVPALSEGESWDADGTPAEVDEPALPADGEAEGMAAPRSLGGNAAFPEKGERQGGTTPPAPASPASPGVDVETTVRE